MELKTFIPWVGSKSRYVNKIISLMPEGKFTYFEPFVGAGSIFFGLGNKTLTSNLSDVNQDLITTFIVLRDNIVGLRKMLKDHQDAKEIHNENYYYALRKYKPRNDVEVAGRFIFLMKLCFNGIYRVNKDGMFNTPLGYKKDVKVFDNKVLTYCHERLQGASITCKDYRDISPNRGDVVYFDPPYFSAEGLSYSHKMYNKYTTIPFTNDDHFTLRDFAKDLAKHGVHVIVSNSDCKEVRDMYEGSKIHDIVVRRNVSGLAKYRNITTELCIVV